MKQILSRMSGFIESRAIVKGMREVRGDQYDFSSCRVECYIVITEDKIETEFTVFPKGFCNREECLYTTKSFKDLRKWLEEHKEELK